MSKAHPPELKKYMDKKLTRVFPTVSMLNGFTLALNTCELKLNGGRQVTGILRGFDPFMNLVVDEALEETKGGEKHNVGMVVIRGNSIVLLEAQDRI